ncbi:MAG: PQQ-binding-like beta-propeller repeat protein [Verrucomicrobiota bacterium]
MRPSLAIVVATSALHMATGSDTAAKNQNWPQPAGPNHNWQIDGKAPTHWSVTRNENIRWRTPMPEAGMSSITIWNNRAFTTTHVPIESEDQKNAVTDIIGFCLDANSGKILWQITLPGSAPISLAGGFTDGTVFAPVTDGTHVWFFNRCGAIACYDFEGNEVWLRQWKPRFKHNNRQAEPFLLNDTLIYVEVADKTQGAKIQKWDTPGIKSKSTDVPEGVDPIQVWTYIHGLDKNTGEVLWREKVGTSVHNTPVLGLTADGSPAIAHARGGPHGPLEEPYGHSLTSLARGQEGVTLWSTDLDRYNPSFASHWNHRYTFGFQKGKHLILDTKTGAVLREQPLYTDATLHRYDPDNDTWMTTANTDVKAGKGHPNTNQTNIAIGEYHWFLAHNFHYLGRVHIETGKVEYLELPAQLFAHPKSREKDKLLWGKGHPSNKPLNAQGFAVGDKGHAGTGWGHISAASPIRVGQYLYCPVVTGTVYVIDTQANPLDEKAIVAINDLGPGGETWTLASLSFANGRLYAHTMREVICIE